MLLGTSLVLRGLGGDGSHCRHLALGRGSRHTEHVANLDTVQIQKRFRLGLREAMGNAMLERVVRGSILAGLVVHVARGTSIVDRYIHEKVRVRTTALDYILDSKVLEGKRFTIRCGAYINHRLPEHGELARTPVAGLEQLIVRLGEALGNGIQIVRRKFGRQSVKENVTFRRGPVGVGQRSRSRNSWRGDFA